MKWSLIQKTPNPTVEAYGYHDPRVKEFLRQEGGLRCVYCAVNENVLGGIQAFHVEHYRPKSKPEFRALENALSNLFYACPICNRFKSNDWPAEPHRLFKNSSYPDPSSVDYTILFNVNSKNGSVVGTKVASKYIVERLYFNRPQLILERRQYFLDQELTELNNEYSTLIPLLGKKGDARSIKYLTKLSEMSNKLNQLLIDLKKIPSYELGDVTKKKK